MCKLKKSLYDLKQTPKQWYKKFESIMGTKTIGRLLQIIVFAQSFSNDNFIILFLYVDNMLIVGKSASRINELKN